MDSLMLQVCYDNLWMADGRMEYMNAKNTTFFINKDCTFHQFLTRVYDILQINHN